MAEAGSIGKGPSDADVRGVTDGDPLVGAGVEVLEEMIRVAMSGNWAEGLEVTVAVELTVKARDVDEAELEAALACDVELLGARLTAAFWSLGKAPV